MGRPSKRTPEIEKIILNSLSVGNTRLDSALAVGVSYNTFLEWTKRFPEFRESVERAEAQARQRFVGQIAVAAQTTWQAAAWYLERRIPEYWGRRDRLDVTMDFHKEAERIAEESGLPLDEVLAEAEAILAGQ